MTYYPTNKTRITTAKLWLIGFGLVVSLVASAIGMQSAFAADGSIGGRPANPQDSNKRTRSIFVHTINPGKTVREGLLVVNNSDTRQTVSVYAVDAAVTSTGSLTCRQRVEKKTDVGSWITMSQSTVTLDPGSDKVVPFSITVPRDGVDVGEHDGCIVIEPVVDEGTNTGGGVRIRTRSALRVAVTIPGELKKDADFVNFKAQSEKGGYRYDVAVKNNGNVSLDTDIRVTLTSLFGQMVYTNGGQYPVIPKTQLELSFVDENPPMFGGWYWADAEIGYDKSVKNELGSQTNQEWVTKQWERQLVFVPPTATGLFILLVLALIIVSLPIYLYRRVVQRKMALRSGARHVVNPGETIRSIADHYKVSWKKLAVFNKIKPPYDLQVGMTLVIPQKSVKKGKVKTKKAE